MQSIASIHNQWWVQTRSPSERAYAKNILCKLRGKPLSEIEQYCTKVLEGYMGQAADVKFGYCIDCRDDDHKACNKEGCRCRSTDAHKDALSSFSEKTDEELPQDFSWEEPPAKSGRHPLTPEMQLLLKSRPGKFAHIRHWTGKSSAYQCVKNFNNGKYNDLDRTDWEFRQVKDGAHGPGSDLYVAYLGGE